jgi:CrcB protein
MPEPEPLPTDSDVDLHLPGQRAELRRAPGALLSVIAAGGALGALARYGLSVAYPVAPDAFPWTTFAVNVSGCLLIGVLMVLVSTVWAGRRLVRPFLGVGVFGGYTTFSTYAVDIQRLVDHRAAATALAYLLATVVCAVGATYAGTAAARWGLRLTRVSIP